LFLFYRIYFPEAGYPPHLRLSSIHFNLRLKVLRLRAQGARDQSYFRLGLFSFTKFCLAACECQGKRWSLSKYSLSFNPSLRGSLARELIISLRAFRLKAKSPPPAGWPSLRKREGN
jgi:hypothetical protein